MRRQRWWQPKCGHLTFSARLYGHELLQHPKMTVLRIELPRLKQQSMNLLHTDPWIGVDDRSHIDPIGPGLGNEGIGLQLV